MRQRGTRRTGAKVNDDGLTGSLFSPDQLAVAATTSPEMHEVIASVRWSYSRRNLLEKCPRQYYYQHYGSLKSVAKTEPAKELLQQLKNLRNRHYQAGQHLHTAIAKYLKRTQEGRGSSVSEMIEGSLRAFRNDVDYSRHDPKGSCPPAGKPPPALLQEYFYALPDADMLCAEAEEKMLHALENFASHTTFAAVRMAGTAPNAWIEESFSLNIGCPIRGKVDLLFFVDGRISIVDWKMGESDAGDDSLQLATYALWACHEYERAPEDIQIFKAFLSSGELVKFSTDAEELEAARARILQDAERMAIAEGYGQNAAIEVFTACAQQGICASCPYLQACPEGKECLGDQDNDAKSFLTEFFEEQHDED
jgi:PD-(D/E)XK nuclease superfamily